MSAPLNTLQFPSRIEIFLPSAFFIMASKIYHATHGGKSEELSRRAQKRKRGHQHHARKYKNNKVLEQTEDREPGTEYYFENGLRKVYPYMFGFNSFVKKRWIGRTLVDVYLKEFRGQSEELLIKEIDRGRVTVNGKKVSPDCILKDNHFVEHIVHRHENPVVGGPLQIIDNTPDVVVVNKPASIPCHPCSRYRFNSITHILGMEHGLKNLRPLYRLDRLTSGVLIIPKTQKMSQRWEKQLSNKEFYKEYVCRVEGEFPEKPVTCNEPIEELCQKIWVFKVGPKGKPSTTTFTRLSYNGKSSVVKCVPLTGRSHQIRIHLQHLGHPIINDPLYNRAKYWKNKGKDQDVESSSSEIVDDIISASNTGRWKLGENPKYVEFLAKKNTTQTENGSSPTGTKVVSECLKEPAVEREKNSGNVFQPEGQTDISLDGNKTSATDADGAVKDETKIADNSESVIDIVESVITEDEVGKTDKNCDKADVCVKEIKQLECPQDSMETSDDKGDKNDKCDINEGKASHCVKGTDESLCTEEIPSKRVKMEKTEPVPGCSGDTEHRSTDNIIASPKLLDDLETESVKPTGVFVEMTRHSVENVVSSKPFVMAEFEESKMTYEEDCEECMNLYKEPTTADLVLYLHAVRYKGPDFDYRAPVPDWANPDWTED